MQPDCDYDTRFDTSPPDDMWEGFSLQPATGARKASPLIEDFDTLRAKDGEWLVKNLWPRVGVCFLAGPSMAGKSFLALELMSSVARGQTVLGRRSLRSGVVYIAAEGANGVRTRIVGLRAETGDWSGHMKFIPDAPNLGDDDSLEFLRQQLDKAQQEFAERGIRLGAIVLDTLSASIPGADENSAKDMSPVLKVLQDLAVERGACVLVVAHVGKEADRGIRGWSGLVANADGVITVGTPSDGLRTGTIVKVKDGESGQLFGFELAVRELHLDADGDPVTTCVIAWRDTPPPVRKSRREKTLSPAMNQVMVALRCLEDGGSTETVQAAGAPPETLGVTLKALQDAAYQNGFGGVEPEDAGERRRWQDSRRKSFANSVGYLVRDGLVRSEMGLVWRLHAVEAKP
jgi:hypothetical protein